MIKEKLDVVGIGNAIVDIISYVEDDFLKDNGIEKGVMTLIDSPESKVLYGKLGAGTEISGGSAANTIVALASMGGKSGFIGKVADDQLGTVFAHDLRSTGVKYNTDPMELYEGVPTSHCLVMMSSDAQRTMCTTLGASNHIDNLDVDAELIKKADVTYLEGYLFDREEAKNAFRLAADIAHANGKLIALTLSDPFCVDRHRDEFSELVKNHVDILFANEAEIKSLYKTENFIDATQHCKVAAITRSEKGSVIISSEGTIDIAAETNNGKIVDSTGAGDLYAAGFLYGYTRGKSLAECGKIASIMAGEIISHVGARPQRELVELLKEHNLV